MRIRAALVCVLVDGLLGAAAPASAPKIITGSFAISGSFTYDTINIVGGAGLDFQATLPPPTAPTGAFIEVTVATGYFAGLGFTPFLTRGKIKNITNVLPVSDPDYTSAPAGGPIFVANFLNNFDVNGGLPGGATSLHFDLTSILLQTGPGCPTTPSCVEGPFILTETAAGLRIDFDVIGNFVNRADTGLYSGSFSVTLNGLTMAEAGNRFTVSGQDLACGVNNLEIPCSYTAQFKKIG